MENCKKKSEKNYCIKEGYTPNENPNYYTDTDTGIIWQPDVYEEAYNIAVKNSCQYIIDIGSGNGIKLKQFEKQFQIIAIDYGVNEELIKQNIRLYQFLTVNLDENEPLIDDSVIENSVVICSDVIEHLKQPDNLLRWLSGVSYKSIAVLISTPERDNTRGIHDMGPPANRAHVREWNYYELHTLLNIYNFSAYTLTYTLNNNVSRDYTTLLAISGKAHDTTSEEHTDLVSIVVPVYNKEKYIQRCFDSIIRQCYKKIECIFVEDCSTDTSNGVIDALVKSYVGEMVLRIIRHKENKGLSCARNTGIKAAKGEYIFFFDSDDEIPENSIGTLIGLAQKYRMADIIQGNLKRIPPMENDVADTSTKDFCEFHGNRQWIKENAFNIHVSSCNKLIRRDFITENNLYFMPRLIREEVHWWFMAFKKIRAIAFTKEICYIYYRGMENSIISNPNKYPILRGSLKLYDEITSNLDFAVFSKQINFVRWNVLNYGLHIINTTGEYKDLIPQFTARMQTIVSYLQTQDEVLQLKNENLQLKDESLKLKDENLKLKSESFNNVSLKHLYKVCVKKTIKKLLGEKFISNIKSAVKGR